MSNLKGTNNGKIRGGNRSLLSARYIVEGTTKVGSSFLTERLGIPDLFFSFKWVVVGKSQY